MHGSFLKCKDIKYKCYPIRNTTHKKESIQPIGIDTEAYINGKCFMIATSLGDVFQPENFPACMFSRLYRGKSFVAYNLKYDSGAFLQNIPTPRLDVLRRKDWCFYKGFHYQVIGNKCLTIRKGKNAIHIYDMYNFYNMSLDNASKAFLHRQKTDIFTKDFYPFIVYHFWDRIAHYCIQDACLVYELAEILIKRFEKYGVYPKKLYSVAYISYQYFREKCPYVVVKRFWENKREVIQYALDSYNGGKFEVTEKGVDNYFEYDIVSAYPFEISQLADITWSRIVYSKTYRRQAIYAFIKCKISIPYNLPSPVVVKRGNVNTYPVGQFEKTITKTEYEYLIANGADIEIIDGYFIHLDNRQYPYRREINKLVKLKQQFKKDHEDFDYHIIKIFLNSLYGKFVQLINKGDHHEASTCWNPIFGSIVTANCRTRMALLQSTFQSTVAVHTDSIITTKKLPIRKNDSLGELSFETQGQGVILGSGIYQIGDKIRFRGFPLKTSLMEIIQTGKKTLTLQNKHAYTWREVIFHNWNKDLINQFTTLDKKVDINFDQKRLWINDWNNFSEIPDRKVESIPLIFNDLQYS